MKLPFQQFKSHEVTMRDRFIVRVLLPPFLLLIVIGGVGFWQLNNFLTSQAIGDLQVAAEATAIRLDREIAIRETVLESTGEEITTIKNNYLTNLATLENNREGCRRFYTRALTFTNAPRGYCDDFATSAEPSLRQIEDVYVEKAKALQSVEVAAINQRLSAFKQFFPETLAVMVFGEDGEIISSALSGDAALSTEPLTKLARASGGDRLRGTTIEVENRVLAVFTFPMPEGGSVLAAYDVNNTNYIDPSWRSTPIDTAKASAIVVETGEAVVYPSVRNEFEFITETKDIAEGESSITELSGVNNVVVSEKVGESDWSILIASPEAIVLGPSRDAQFVTFIIGGLFIIGFLWVGTFFIKRMTDNLAKLVTGAMIYGSGRLDYKLDISSSEKEFRQLADTMNYMAQRIAISEKENDERNKEFISIATHELRAPMTSIIGYLSMFKENREKRLSKKDKLLLDSAYDGTLKLRDLVNDMLDAARLEGGREEFTIQKLKMSDFVEACFESMKVVAGEGKVSLKYDSKSAADVFADEGKLRIILNNFVSNAIKYNHKSGHVKVTHTKHKGQLVTAIANSGPTIPKDQQEHMFEKFFRVDTPEHRKVTGTGVGMFVTKQYVLAMNGDVWFMSEPGKDTVFYFSLPIADGSKSAVKPTTVTPKPQDSRWIMRWRKHLQ